MSTLLEFDGIVITDSFCDCKANFEADLERLNVFFRRWRLQLNPTKTEICVFHLSTHDVNRVLDVQFANTQVQHVDQPKYTLDWTLTYNTHLTKSVNLVHKLTDTNWGTWLRWLLFTSLLNTAFRCG
jgi:hypothetical protein